MDIHGNTTNGSPNKTTVAVGSVAGFGTANTLSNGNVSLKGNALLQFASGQITTTAFGANLTIDGTKAFIADVGSTSSNSALTGLATLGGSLTLLDGATISTSGGLTVGDGTHGSSVQVYNGGGLTVSGTLADISNCSITVGSNGDTTSTTVTATGLTNPGTITISGSSANNGVNHGNLVINGSASNAGTINVTLGTLHIAGALSGAGTINLTRGILEARFFGDRRNHRLRRGPSAFADRQRHVADRRNHRLRARWQ